jgi:type I restriction enzyme S subunit
MPNISKSRLEGLEVEKAEPALQHRFARLALQKDAAERKQQEAKQRLEDLYSVLLHRAFSGELTASWRETHMKELLGEMEHQARILGTPQEEMALG